MRETGTVPSAFRDQQSAFKPFPDQRRAVLCTAVLGPDHQGLVQVVASRLQQDADTVAETASPFPFRLLTFVQGTAQP